MMTDVADVKWVSDNFDWLSGWMTDPTYVAAHPDVLTTRRLDGAVREPDLYRLQIFKDSDVIHPEMLPRLDERRLELAHRHTMTILYTAVFGIGGIFKGPGYPIRRMHGFLEMFGRLPTEEDVLTTGMCIFQDRFLQYRVVSCGHCEDRPPDVDPPKRREYLSECCLFPRVDDD